MYNPRLKIGNLLILCVIIGLSSCATNQALPRKSLKKLDQQIGEAPIFKEIFSGFALYDPELQEMLYQHEADKYYTPASNTKLFTFYTALKILGDSIPLFRYLEKPEYTILQGTGNPTFMHPDFPVDSNLIRRLQSLSGNLYFSPDNYLENRFGPGWSWADYSYYYQVEKSSFPIYGNFIRVEADTIGQSLWIHPKSMEHRFYYNQDLDAQSGPEILRLEHDNLFEYNRAVFSGTYFSNDLPFYKQLENAPILLGEILDRPVALMSKPERDTVLPFQMEWGVLEDTLLRKFMQESDNFIAEQLLLACSAKLFNGQLSSAKVIRYSLDSILNDLPDQPRWVDGSGLSRYNLFTPRSIVSLLDKLYKEYPKEWLFSVLPNGGKSGTIRNWYGGKTEPYVFAKTGTLSNKHCLSGYVKTQSGKTLIFSFMHNNYLGSSAPLKREMQKVLEFIWETY